MDVNSSALGFRGRLTISLLLATGTSIMATGLAAQVTVGDRETYTFMALGDTAYNVPDDYPAWDALIESINASSALFSVHIGDTKGRGSCNEERQQIILSYFQKFERPLVYTPGDNEWTDCRDSDGNENRLEVLASIRRIFFSEAESLGVSPMPLTRQSDISRHETLVENSRWTAGKIMFSTVHVTGGSNNRRPDDPPSMADYTSRTEAAVDWIDEAFAIATRDDYVGVVIGLHAEIFSLASIAGAFGGGGAPGGQGGMGAPAPQGGMGAQGGRGGAPALSMEERMTLAFGPIIDALKRGAEGFSGQVLLIHGDTHELTIDRPFKLGQRRVPAGAFNFENFTRLEVYGPPELRAVEVTVQPDTPWVFSFSPFYPHDN